MGAVKGLVLAIRRK